MAGIFVILVQWLPPSQDPFADIVPLRKLRKID